MRAIPRGHQPEPAPAIGLTATRIRRSPPSRAAVPAVLSVRPPSVAPTGPGPADHNSLVAPLAGAAIRSGINGINFVQQAGPQCFGYL